MLIFDVPVMYFVLDDEVIRCYVRLSRCFNINQHNRMALPLSSPVACVGISYECKFLCFS